MGLLKSFSGLIKIWNELNASFVRFADLCDATNQFVGQRSSECIQLYHRIMKILNSLGWL